MQILASEAACGATVTGVDLAKLSRDEWAEIHRAFLAHAVLVFPAQHLTSDAQVAFSRRFGPLERLIIGGGANPAIGVLANLDRKGRVVPPEGKTALFLKGNTVWHTDSSYKPVPALASLLSASVLPSTGGETEFADMRAAHDALGDALRERIEGFEAVHDYIYSQGLIGGLDVMSPEEQAALPPVVHPVVRTHPETGRRNLYIGRHASHIVGMAEQEGRALLAELLDFACRPPRLFAHRWGNGDLVLWDNRRVLHRGRPWPADEPRVMNRTTVAGEAEDESWVL